MLASCSYDMTVRLWDVAAPEDAMLQVRMIEVNNDTSIIQQSLVHII